jgi:hypothetical protein
MKPVGSARMKDFLERLELSGILKHYSGSHPTRGRTNYYYSEFKDEDIWQALKELGIKVYGTGLCDIDDSFEK